MSIWNRMFGKKDQDESKAGVTLARPLQNTPVPDKASGASMAAKITPLSAAKDRVVRVFVSSTFKDMIEDRNELMAHVWPALRKVCRERSVEFVEVDLRWGVTEEQSQRKETLRHCLAEIKRCRPYFIGLLGERYGWTPGQEAYSQALLDEEGWLKNKVAKHSVTELEILHGVLNDPDMAGRAFFYFRDPQYAQGKGAEFLPEDAAKAEKQNALKKKVKSVCEAKHSPLHEDYANPAALVHLVRKDLESAIDAEFPEDEIPDAWTRENRDHEAFAKSRRTSFYVGRDAYYNALDTFARDGAGGCGLTLLGESGGGKSALLANWLARWHQAHPGDYIFQHYIGSTAGNADHLSMLRRLMVSVIRWRMADEFPTLSDEDKIHKMEEELKQIPAKAEEIVKAVPQYLGHLTALAKRKGVRAVLVFDALNQLEEVEHARLLGWLPHRLPEDVRLIVSTLPGETLNALGPRAWPTLNVEPLTPKERETLIACYLEKFSQALSAERAKRIAAADAAANPLYIKTLLDDLRVTGDHEKLDKQIDGYLKATNIPVLFAKILARFATAYERDRPGLVRDTLSLLWAARRGLSEPELLEVLKPGTQERLPAALWSPIRYALEDALVEKNGILSFAHDHLRQAVEQSYLSGKKEQQQARLQLADYFETQAINARTSDELPWLLHLAEQRDRLRACLLDIDRFLLIHDRDENELLGYWVWLKEEHTMGQPYVQAFQQWAKGKGETATVSSTANQLASFLSFCAALHADAEPLMRRALKIDETNLGSEHPNVATKLNNLVVLLQDTNRLAEAEPLMRRALKIDEQRYGENHPRVARDLNNLAGLLQDTNRLAEAEPLMRRALQIDEQRYGENHPRVAIDLSNLAQVLQATNRLAEAEPLMRRSLQIDKQNYGDNHPRVAIDLNNLAQLLQDTNRVAEAEPLVRRALQIFETSLGSEHPKVATQLNNLAGLLQATNRLTEAEPLMRRALQIDEQRYGENHPSVATTINNLAVLLQATNRFADAEPLVRRALKIGEQSYGENHPDVAIRLNNLAQLLKATNRLAEAEPLMRRALQIDGQSYGENHPDVARDLNNLAQLLKATNRLAEAEPLMRRALQIDEQSYGENHPAVARDLNNLIQLLEDTNRLAEAEPLMCRALNIDEQNYGENHPRVAIRLNNLAQLLHAANRFAEAETLMRRAMNICTASLGGSHPNTQAISRNHADLLQTMGRSA